MSSEHEGRVRVRAYHLWREGGGEHGREVEHWLEAEREMSRTGSPKAKPAKRNAVQAGAGPKAATAKTVRSGSGTGRPSSAKTPPTKTPPVKAATKAPAAKAAPAKPGSPSKGGARASKSSTKTRA